MDGSGYWRSLGELADSPEFRAMRRREFPEGAADAPGPFSRRRFLQIMSASVALAGFSGCRWPKEEIVPYAHRPEGLDPGEPRAFATSREAGGVARSLVVTSYDGRPTKVEGNRMDPIGRGATSVHDQALVLDMYDPDRSRAVVRRDGSREIAAGWDEYEAWSRERFAALRAARGAGAYVLTPPSSSLVLAAQKKRFLEAMPEAVWLEWDPTLSDAEREAVLLVYGDASLRPRYLLENADVIVSLDADLFGEHPEGLRLAREFAAGRRVDETKKMNRLYAVESVPSITGSMADHRLPLESGRIGAFAAALAAELVFGQGLEADGAVRRALESRREPEDVPIRFVRALAKDLAARPGRSVIAAGARQSAETHTAALLVNEILGNREKTLVFARAGAPAGPPRTDIEGLAADLDDGKVKTLLILEGNPVYDAPANLDLAGKIAKAGAAVHLSTHRNETSLRCAWNLPRTHELESWDAGRSADGSLVAAQPLIDPLYDGRTPGEIVALAALGSPRPAYDLAREAAAPFAKGEEFERFWRRLLHDGVIPAAAEAPRPKADAGRVAEALGRIPGRAGGEGEFEVVFLPDASTGGGRYANNAWLQELPDPITKITWDNAALLGPAAAKALGVKTEDVIRIERGERSIEIVACVLPGVAGRTIALPLGYGREAAGRVGDGVGVDTYRFRTSDALWIAGGAAASRTGRRHELAVTQDHFLIDDRGKRELERRVPTLVREVDAGEYAKDPEGAMHHGEKHEPPLLSLWKEHKYDQGHSWGMAIDLNACTGCNACVVACQSENNIPVVGKEQVINQREMHWIRVDRYFHGDPDAPEMVHQPVACVHCEMAPCEEVCPVGATMHSSEGLNTMVYNRCIGTRYCSNNCPYKVRRFNFFNYHKKLDETEKMQFNPEVTVRSRGVMEKCTYCVQRIEAVKIAAKNEKRPVRDGEVTPACAEACPTDAIVFGDLNDKESRVAKRTASHRAYSMLGELNIKPHTNYLARVRNRNPELTERGGHEPRHG